MTLRRFLLLPLLVSLAFFIYFSHDLHSSFIILSNTIHLTVGFMNVLLVAALLQLCGHVVRAYKAKLIFGVAKESSTRFQFRALSLGYLFNTLLPFRLGELIRARIISGAMTISFGYAIVLVIFERLIDAIILGVVGLVLIVTILGTHHPQITYYIVLLLTIGLVGLLFYGIVARQNKLLLKAWSYTTALLNNNLKLAARFKAWTIIYGLQQTLRWRLMLRYIGLSLVSWVFYGLSLYDLSAYMLRHVSASSRLLATAAPYYGTSVPAGPASLGVFSKVVNQFTAQLGLSFRLSLAYDLTAWAVLILPITIIGLVLLYSKTKETLWYKRPQNASQTSLMNKLYRTEDISLEMEAFLESYFSGNTLSRIVHGMELQKDFKLLKYFKGGSDAITILALQNGKQIVKKIIPHEFENRLKAQYDWLRAHDHTPGIVTVLAEQRTPEYYAIDLSYDPNNEMFYEFIHKNTLKQSEQVLDETWRILSKSVYRRLKRVQTHSAKRKTYIQRHIVGSLKKAAVIEPELVRATKSDKLIVNGVEYDNLYQIMQKIEANKNAWYDIATYRQSESVHGDVTVDNLLVSKKAGKVMIIDPAPDGNIFEGPVFDFGKLMQSLYCGYETLLRDEEAIYLIEGNKINYRDHKSGKYTHLSNYARRKLAPKYLTENEQRAMLFHAGALYIRRLKHQVYYTPANVLKFYAVGVKTLNDFLAQYD
jgi:lysylphosphatidylglycerol synthase-like protein